MNVAPRFNRKLAGYAAAAILTLLALGVTYHVPFFRSIPWALSFLAVVFVAWIGGMGPAVAVIVAASVGVYTLILAPVGGYLHDPIAVFKMVAFILIALFLAYLMRQRNLAIESLEASEMHYRSVTETASDVVVTIDGESRILSINPAVKTVFGYEPEELVGKEMLILMPERFRAMHLGGIARYLATGERRMPWTSVQLTGRCKDGEEVPLEISFGCYTTGGQTRFTGFIRDASDRRKSEAALMQSEKLAAVGRLASSIAHEINNPLEAVTNLLYLSRGSSAVDEVHRYLEAAELELRRISVIANQTLQFHKSSSVPAEVPCERLIDGSLALFQGRLTNARISVKQRMRAHRAAFCVEGEMRQVLNNLIGNAIDALPKQDGRILVRGRDATEWKSGRTGVTITVADYGEGMSAETREKMFEPFFSTKGEGGAGLGLWICSQLIRQNHASLRVRSRQSPGRCGTVIALFLPDARTL
jgi:PAS domain S-box-containing protein